MRRLTANYIYTPEKGFLRFGIFVLDDKNNVVEVIDTKGQMQEMHSMEFHSGLLVNCRINNDDLLKYKSSQAGELSNILNELINEKSAVGFSILSDIDFAAFSLKNTSSARVII